MARATLASTAVLLLSTGAEAFLTNGLAVTPQMGWVSLLFF